jgi:putative peptidoglycan lipid II flippase
MPETTSATEAPVVALGSQRTALTIAALLGATTLLVKVAALAKDWLVARQLGAGDELDAYLVAFLLPSYAVVVLAHSIASAMIPSYVRLWHERGLASAQRLAGGVLAGMLALLTAVTLVLLVAAPVALPWIGLGFSAEKMALAVALFYPMAVVVLASGTSATLAAVLNAHERFLAAAIAPVAVPLGTLATFALYQERFGVQALAAGTVVGFLIELVVLAVFAWWQGLLPLPRADRAAGELAHVGSQYLHLVLGALLMSSSLVVDQSMAASLGSGQVSIQQYGGKVVAVVLAVGAASLSTVLFPRFAHLIATRRYGDVQAMLRYYTRLIVLVSVPVVAILALFSEPLVRLLFERGAFTAQATAATSAVQLCLLPQIPFYVLAMLGARVLSALDGNAVVLRIGALNLAVNVVGNYVLMQWFGVRGIALATSLVYVVAALVTLLAIRVKLADAALPRSG